MIVQKQSIKTGIQVRWTVDYWKIPKWENEFFLSTQNDIHEFQVDIFLNSQVIYLLKIFSAFKIIVNLYQIQRLYVFLAQKAQVTGSGVHENRRWF